MDLARSFRLIFALVFPGAISLPLAISALGPAQEISETERRRLAAAPTATFWQINDFPAQFEAWFNDHFGLRRPLIRLHNLLKVTGLGVSSTKAVLVGKHGWLFQGGEPHIHDLRNAWPFSQHELRHWARVLQIKHDWLAQRGIAYYFVVVPSKHQVYPEYLPASAQRVSDTSRSRQLIDYLRAHSSVNVIDLRPAIEAAKAVQRSYHKTDTHWNDYGAYLGYRAVTQKLRQRFPDIKTLSLQPGDFITVTQPGGDLARNLDLADVLKEKDVNPHQAVMRCSRNPTLGPDPGHDALVDNDFATYCDDASYRVLMFRDSFSVAMMPYLSESFAYVYYFPHSPASTKGLKVMVERHRPDIVIEQRASRWLRTPEG